MSTKNILQSYQIDEKYFTEKIDEYIHGQLSKYLRFDVRELLLDGCYIFGGALRDIIGHYFTDNPSPLIMNSSYYYTKKINDIDLLVPSNTCSAMDSILKGLGFIQDDRLNQDVAMLYANSKIRKPMNYTKQINNRLCIVQLITPLATYGDDVDILKHAADVDINVCSFIYGRDLNLMQANPDAIYYMANLLYKVNVSNGRIEHRRHKHHQLKEIKDTVDFLGNNKTAKEFNEHVSAVKNQMKMKWI